MASVSTCIFNMGWCFERRRHTGAVTARSVQLGFHLTLFSFLTGGRTHWSLCENTDKKHQVYLTAVNK